jgi:hypothetical protein
VVHVRFCSQNSRAKEKFKFNINQNTLSADYEVWICGNSSVYFLIPISFLREIYNNPNTYEDRRHPGIKVVSVDIATHAVTYATGGVNANLSQYFGATLHLT